MKTQTLSKTTKTVLVIEALLSFHGMSAHKNTVIENTAPTHSIIFISSALFFIVSFVVLLILKLRNDAKEKKEIDEPITHTLKRKHHHPNHYGHRHQYH